jgi:plastocyanin domain-containing protein
MEHDLVVARDVIIETLRKYGIIKDNNEKEMLFVMDVSLYAAVIMINHPIIITTMLLLLLVVTLY